MTTNCWLNGKTSKQLKLLDISLYNLLRRVCQIFRTNTVQLFFLFVLENKIKKEGKARK